MPQLASQLPEFPASAKLGVNMVATFIGRDQTKTVEENLELVKEIWPSL